MLPIYQAISINHKAIHSGSTKPCLMTLADENGNIKGEYVVKIFKPTNLQQSANTNKEIYGNILATAFELNTPKAVLAKVGQEIIDILNQSDKYKGFNLIKGTYFATEYIENPLDYSESKQIELGDWEIENIFAFDVLIRNQDRHKKKPNLFFKDREIYLIDHELSFATGFLDKSFTDMLKEKAKYWEFIEIEKEGFTRKHLFLAYLRERNKKNKVEFDTFAEFLRTFDVDLLDDYQRQLQNLGNDTEDYYAIKSYLTEVKQHSNLFIQLLKELIQ